MRLKLMIVFFSLTLMSIFPLPSESKLGESYKLIYFHVPVTFVTLGSLLLFPILHFRVNNLEMKALSISTVTYSMIHLIISSIFMLMTWGDLIFSEVRFVFSIAIFMFAATHSLLCFIDIRLARIYSFLVYPLIPYFYLQLTKAEFQLHPTVIQMPAMLYIPYFFSIPFVFLFYLMIGEKIRNRLSFRFL